MTETHTPKPPSLILRSVRWLLAWAVAAIVTGLLATFMSTQFVISDLTRIGADIPFGKRLSMTGSDLAGLGMIYTPILALGLGIAFLVATGIYRGFRRKLNGRLRAYLFMGAGLVCVAVTLQLMQKVFFGVDLIAGARSSFGFIVQTLCGAAGGWVFSKITKPKLG